METADCNQQKVRNVTIETEEMEMDVIQSVKCNEDGIVIHEAALPIVAMA